MSAEKLPLSLKAGREIFFYVSLALLSGLCLYQCLECFLRYDKRQTFVSKEIVEQRKTQVRKNKKILTDLFSNTILYRNYNIEVVSGYCPDGNNISCTILKSSILS